MLTLRIASSRRVRLIQATTPRSMSSKANSRSTRAAEEPVPRFQARRWHERGSADHGWLKTFHTFSFANYYDPRFEEFGPLRVLNEDRVAPKTGFPTHAHNNAEIFSYIISGKLTHRDSMGNVEVLKRGEVQFTSAGSGIRHSEYNDSSDEQVHFLQIWYTPNERNLTPKYYSTPHIDDSQKRDRFLTLIKPVCTFSAAELSQTGLLPNGRAIPAHSSLSTSVALLSPGCSAEYAIGSQTESKVDSERWLYVHLAMVSGWKEPRLHAQRIRKYVSANQTHAIRLEHAAQFLQGVYATRPAWAKMIAHSDPPQTSSRSPLLHRADRPRVTLTFAQSIDGFIAGQGKKQVALSSPESFVMTHALRTMHDGILVGIGTLINDNPQLNARLLSPLPSAEPLPVSELPRPIILDTHLRTPLDRKILSNFKAGIGAKPLIVTKSLAADSADDARGTRKEALLNAGAEILEVDSQGDKLDWTELLRGLKRSGIERVMVEGGADVISSLLAAHNDDASCVARSSSESVDELERGLIDTVIVTISRTKLGSGVSYEAPPWLGGALLPNRFSAPSAASRKGADAGALRTSTLTPEPFGQDFVLAWGGAPLDSSDTSQARVQIHVDSKGPEQERDKKRLETQLVELEEGDGVFVRGAQTGQMLHVRNVAGKDAEVIIFDVEPDQKGEV